VNRYDWDIPEEIRKEIRHFPPDLKRQIRATIDDIQKKSAVGKLLSEELAGYRSYRIGRYHLIYRTEGERLVLKAIGPRSDIYERLVLEIGRAKIRERSAKYNARPRKRVKVTA
jgi:mRNA-degrading endonuclease RelE of RelBE toxin-antitoxin system